MATHAPLLHRPAPARSPAPGVATAAPATRGTLPSWSIASLAAGPGAVLQGYFIGANSAMSEQDLATAIAAHPKGAQLTPAMHGEIRRRHGHANQGYHLHNTIAGLLSGDIAPKPPPADGPKPQSRRVAAGLVNLPHMHANMMPLFAAAANTPPPSPAVRSEREHLESPTRHFNTFTPTHTQPPVLVQGHGNTVMGHGPEDAVDYFNRVGHTQSRAQNQEHNSSAAIFHGLEEYHASAKSGGETKARYRSPSPTHGGHPSYWDRSHPDFDPRVRWHTYANATDAQNGIRYVPPVTAAIVPQVPVLAKPTPLHPPAPQTAPAPNTFAAPSLASSSLGAPSPMQSAFSAPSFASSSSSSPLLKPSAFAAPSFAPSTASPMSDSGSPMDFGADQASDDEVSNHNAAPYQSSAPSYHHPPAAQPGFGFSPPSPGGYQQQPPQLFQPPSFGPSAFHQAPQPRPYTPPPLHPFLQYRPEPLQPLFGLSKEEDLGLRKMDEEDL